MLDGQGVRLTVCEDGVSPGQACVIYDTVDDGARVLGGGVISTAVPAWRPEGHPSEAVGAAAAAVA